MCRNCDPGRSLILGVLGILPEHLIGEELAADYLLFQLNKNRQFGYVQVLGLNGPTNDIYEVTKRPLPAFPVLPFRLRLCALKPSLSQNYDQSLLFSALFCAMVYWLSISFAVCVLQVSRHICQTLGRRQERFSLPPVDLSRGFVFFLNLFREGHLASLCLDTLPYAADVVLRRDVLGQQRCARDPLPFP